MIRRILIIGFVLCLAFIKGSSQCITPITSFPYNEGFEMNNGGWTPGGSGSDWAWGTPVKTVINAAGGGTKCWIVGGLSGGSYTDGEASWLQSPCFDFTGLQYPYMEFKVFWETENRFDGANLQYSIDDGASWTNVGMAGQAVNCMNENWYNSSSINYIASLSPVRHGWTGNIQPGSGSCQGGGGSNGWLIAKQAVPALKGEPRVIFRFIFGAGTICNNYDGFAIDDITIKEAPANAAGFSYTCAGSNAVNFINQSSLCPTGFEWDFGDPVSGGNNTSTLRNPTHQFSGPGVYDVTLKVTGPGNPSSSITKQITVLGVTATVLSAADCNTGMGGSAIAVATGSASPVYSWNTNPVQSTAQAVNLEAKTYTVTVTAAQGCPATADITIPLDLSCIGVFFPTAFTPNGDGLNDFFGPLGSLAALDKFELSIYNRWGEKVFHSTNPFIKWDGRYKGSRASSDVFVWQARFSLAGAPAETRKGVLTLVR